MSDLRYNFAAETYRGVVITAFTAFCLSVVASDVMSRPKEEIMVLFRRTNEEMANTWTHFIGFLYAVLTSWVLIWLGSRIGWQMTLGVCIFAFGMMMMYGSSALYHWVVRQDVKRVLRKFDHISIFVMIAASYTPICIGVVGGVLGWTMFAVQWALVLAGIFYKVFALGRWPALSLGIYLTMGWSVVFVIKPVFLAMNMLSVACVIAEGVFYTAGTYFYVHDRHRKYYHAVWHVFVLLGSLAHWLAVLFLLLNV